MSKHKFQAKILANIKMWKFGDISENEAKMLSLKRSPDFEKKNIVVLAGRSVIARLLAGDDTYSGEINYGALGTGDTTPVEADTKLETEVFRKIVSSQAFADNSAYVDFFYTAGDCDGTYEEFGNFIDGEVGADTGQLFSHILTGGWVKSSSESLFISCSYTIL